VAADSAIGERALHQRITADIEDKIRSGAWPPGFRIPFEHELTLQYGCARATVNKAVSALAAAGLIERRRRAGSFVARQHIQSAVLEIPDIEAEVTRRGQAYGYALLSRAVRRVDAANPDETRLGGDACLEINCLHLADGQPLALEHRLINLDVAPQASAMDFAETAPGGWLLRHVPWTEAEHRISAINPDKADARQLKVRPADACLSVQRWTWRVGEGVTFVRQLFPGDAYDLVARFTPGAASGS
jgi:GntR family histidine utilization transcriptional repressor